MKRVEWCLFLVVLCLSLVPQDGLAEIMYVTDRLYLSFRSAPDPDEPAIELLPSDTKVDILMTEGDWAKVSLEDGRTGWVMKKYLVENLPKSLVIEELIGQLGEKDLIVERLQQENASLKKQVSDRVTLETKEATLKERIETLENQIVQQRKSFELTTKQNTQKTLKRTLVTGIVALFVGLMIGYLVRRQRKKQLSPSYL